MAEDLGSLIIKLKVDLADAQKKLHELQKDMSAVDKVTDALGLNTSKLTSAWKVATNPATLLATAVTGMGAALVVAIKSTSEYGEQLNTMSRQTGIATETLSKLKFAAEQEETSLEALNHGMKFLQREMALLGDTRTPYERLLELSDQMKALQNPAQRTELAIKNFGRSGYALIPFLTTGSDHIEALGKRAEELGVVLSGETARASDEFRDSLAETRTALLGVQIALAKELLPAVTEGIKHLTNFVIWLGKVVEKLKDWSTWIADSTKKLAEWTLLIATLGLSKVAKEAKDVAKATGLIAEKTEEVTKEVKKESRAVRKLEEDWDDQTDSAMFDQIRLTSEYRSKVQERISAARMEFERTASFWDMLAIRMTEATSSWAQVFVGTIQQMTNSMASGVAQWVVHGGSFRDTMKKIWDDMLVYFIESIIKKMVAEWMASVALMQGSGAGLGGAGLFGAGTQTAGVAGGGGAGAIIGQGLAGAGIMGLDYAYGQKNGLTQKEGILSTGLLTGFGGSTVASGVKKLGKKIKKKFSGGIVKEPAVLITESGQMAQVGDKGPEALVSFEQDLGISPSKARERLAGTKGGHRDGVHIHFTNNTFVGADKTMMENLVRLYIIPALDRDAQRRI